MSNKPERRRRFVRATAPAFGLLAAGLLVWQGSYAAFSATTQDNTNTWSTATLSLKNDGGVAGAYAATTTATFGGANLKPGATGTTCLTVQSIGTSAGSMAMYESALADSAPSLGAQIKLTVGWCRERFDERAARWRRQLPGHLRHRCSGCGGDRHGAHRLPGDVDIRDHRLQPGRQLAPGQDRHGWLHLGNPVREVGVAPDAVV